MRQPQTAEDFLAALREQRSPAELPLIRKRLGPADDALGIRMRDLFDTAKRAAAMPLEEVERLLASDLYEARMGAFCILDFRAKDRRCDPAERERLYTTYLTHHDRITTWDMVDRAAPSVIGGRLLGRSSPVLLDLARSSDPLRRRTAVTAPLWFVRYGSDVDLAKVPALAAALVTDPDPVVHLAVGTLLKHTGARNPQMVGQFLQDHTAVMPRAVLRAATSKLPPEARLRSREGRDSPGGHHGDDGERTRPSDELADPRASTPPTPRRWHPTGPLDVTFTATVERSTATGGWTYVVWPESVTFFGTRARVKIAGTVDGAPIRTSFMPLGDGRHKLPITGKVLTAIGKTEGDTITVHLTDRIG